VPRRASSSPLFFLGGLLGLYLAVPIAAFLVRLAGPESRGFSEPGLYHALYISALAATISASLIALFGIPLAYVLARSHSRIMALVGVIVVLPLAIPPLMSGMLLIFILGPYSTLGTFFDGRLTSSLAGIVLAQTFVAAPFLIVVARSAFASIDPALFDLAAGLGRRELARFWRVALPTAREGLRAGLLLAWLRAFGEFGATVIIAFHPTSLPVYTYLEFSSAPLSETEAPTALALAIAVVVLVLSRLRWRPARKPALPPSSTSPRSVAGEPVSFDLDLRLGSFHLRLDHRGRSERLAILGPSGSGKSATLRCLAGLYGPGPGTVRYGSRDVSRVPTEERRIGYLPQDSGLFPHLTVWRQLLFGTDADPSLAAFWLDRLGLNGLENRLPHELSGGQRRRVGLAQALTRSPDLLLLDEPFSALDTPVADELRRDVHNLQRETGLSTVLVTHNPEEAALLADEIIIITDGTLLQSGTRQELFKAPASSAAARLLGITNVFEGQIRPDGAIACSGATIDTRPHTIACGTEIWWRISPEDVTIGPPGNLSATVVDTLDLGTRHEALLQVTNNLVIRARITTPDVAPGERHPITLPPEHIDLWPRLRQDRPNGRRAVPPATPSRAS